MCLCCAARGLQPSVAALAILEIHERLKQARA
jgi:hypothetical protein